MLPIPVIRKEEYYTEDNVTVCALTCKGGDVFIGYASCAEEDMSFKSDLVGKHIAYTRATINLLQNLIATELNPQIKVLSHLENAIKMRGGKHDRGDRLILRELNRTMEYKNELKIMIAGLKKGLKDYIDNKAELYEKITVNRKASQSKDVKES